ncbi:hypothetical protein HPY21_15460 [Bacillus stratosphericus]|nr:hypothetical protein [Bacillus stratosphericus]
MTYLHYQYCLSEFVIANEYKLEYFEEESNFDYYHQTLLDNIANYTKNKIQNPQELIRRVYVPMSDIDMYISDENEFYTFDPLSDTPELYLEMNKVVIFDEKSLMKFIKNYGIAFHLASPTSESGLFNSTLFQINDSEKFILEMDALIFFEGLAKFQSILKMWNDIKEDNLKELINIKKEFQSLAEFHNNHKALFKEADSLEKYTDFIFTDSGVLFTEGEMEDVIKAYKNKPDKLIKVIEKSSELKNAWERVKNNSDLKTIAFAYLNLKLKDIKSGETATRFIDGKIVPAMRFNNPLEVAGYQLKQAIFKDQKLELCENCGALFEPRHASQKFCSPLPGRKRSTCENTYNQRLKRMRKKKD